MRTNCWLTDDRHLICTAPGSGRYEVSVDYPPPGGWVAHLSEKRWATPAVLVELALLLTTVSTSGQL
jgi:hypothetical protein